MTPKMNSGIVEEIREADVLNAFQKAHPNPTPIDVMDAAKQWPNQTGAIRKLAATLLELRMLGGEGDLCPETKQEFEEALRASSRFLLNEVRRLGRSAEVTALTRVSRCAARRTVEKVSIKPIVPRSFT